MSALTHLTLSHALVCPLPLFSDSNGQALPNLLYLNISFLYSAPSSTVIRLPLGSKVQEIYIAGPSCDHIDFAGCTSLTSLGIMYSGREFSSLGLPTSLERLCLHNMLKVVTDPRFSHLNNLRVFKVGAQPSVGVMKCLPELPPSLLELDLWDGVVTNLDRLTSLTRLKKLRMPLPPTPKQLSIIKRLRQLRHIEVTTHKGIGPLPVLICLPCNNSELGVQCAII